MASENNTNNTSSDKSEEFKRLIEEGGGFLEQGKYNQAVESFTAAIDLGPKNADGYAVRGNAYTGKGEYEQAIKDYSRAIELEPKKVSAYVNRGNIYFQRGELDKAIEDYSKVIEDIDGKNIDAWFNRGATYIQKGELDKAIKDCNKIIDDFDNKHVNAYVNRGAAYIKKGGLDRAIEDCNKAIELEPKKVSAYVNRGNVYNKQKRYDKAIEDFSKVIKDLDDKYVDAYVNRGAAYFQKGELDKVIGDCSKAIELEPKKVSAYVNRGNAYDKQKRYDRAIEDFSKVIKDLDDKYVDAWFNRGNAYFNKEEYDKAIEDFDKVIRDFDDKYVDAYVNRGVVYFRKRELEKAIKDFDKVIDNLDDKNVQAYVNRGVVYFQRGELEKAIKDLDKAINIDKKMNRDAKLPFDNLLLYIIDRTKKIKKSKDRRSIFNQLFLLQNKVADIKSNLYKRDETPDLAHYTSLDVLNKVLNKPTLRMSRVVDLNDPTEGRHLLKLVPELKEFYPEKDGGKLLDEDINTADQFHGYSLSLTREKEQNGEQKEAINSLNLWRLYGRDGKGAKIVINKEVFENIPDDSTQLSSLSSMESVITQLFSMENDGKYNEIESAQPPLKSVDSHTVVSKPLPSFRAYQVCYLEESDGELSELADVLTKLKGLCPSDESEGSRDHRRLIQELVRFIIDGIRFLYKTKYYEHENEYRMFCVLHVGDGNIKTDPRQMKFYVDVPNKPFLFEERSKIYIGPTADGQENKKDFLEYYKKAENRENDEAGGRDYEYEVRISKIPYKSAKT